MEMAILAPALICVLALVAIVGRLGNSKLDLDAAAQSAARTIAIARSPQDAIAGAQDAAAATLRVGSPTCREWTFDADVTATEVTVEVTCVVDLSTTSLLPVPGSKTFASSATEVIDRFREQAS